MEFEKIQTIIADVLSIHNPEEITMDKSFKDDLGADSLDSVEIVMRLEEAFDIEIPDDAVLLAWPRGASIAPHKQTGRKAGHRK